MTKQVQRRRGTATQHTSFTGAEGEISVNTTNKSIHVHDGVTAGGVEAARADMTNVSDANLNARLNGNTLSSLTITSADINGGNIDGTVIGGTTPAAVTGTTITGTSFVSSGDMTFGDNDKAIFGAGSQLQIYSDGTKSYITEGGSGDLEIRATDLVLKNAANTKIMATFTDGGAAIVRYDNAVKLATTSTGVDVTGTITSDGLTVDTNTLFVDATNNRVGIGTSSPNVKLDLYGSGATSIFRLRTADGGSATFDGSGDGFELLANQMNTTNKYTPAIKFGSTDSAFTTTNPKFGAAIVASAVQTYGADTNGGMDLTFWTSPADPGTGSGLQERMTIRRDGNVGIGMIPTGRLSIRPSGTGSEDSHIGFGANLDTYITTGANGIVVFREGNGAGVNTERMRIDASGSLLVGKTASGYSANGFEVTSTGLIYAPAGSASAPAITFSGDTNTGIGFGGADILYMSTGGFERMRIDSSGSVGIGTSSPSAKLDVVGNTELNGTLVVSGTAQIGRPADNWSTSDYYDVAGTGGLSTQGSYGVDLVSNGYRNNSNTWTGFSAGGSTGAAQISLRPNGTIYFYTDATKANGSSIYPTIRMALNDTGLGIGTTGISALLDVAGDAEINGLTVGHGAGNIGSNTALGFSTLASNTTGSSNVAVGYLALTANTTGTTNVAVGRQALEANTTGINNVAVGLQALNSNTTAGGNTAVGLQTLRLNTTGGSNTALGQNAGDVLTTGSRNALVGFGCDPSALDGNDQVVIGYSLVGKGNDTAFIGGLNGAYNEKNVTTWETTSDERIKKNIVDNNEGLSVLSQIQVRNFEYRTPEEITDLPSHAAIEKGGIQLGVIAQELQQVLPECVSENSTGVLSVNTDPLVWYLINAVKELKAEIEQLKGK